MPNLREMFLATIMLCLLSVGCRTALNEPKATGATQKLPHGSVPMTYHVDVIGPLVNPLINPSGAVPSKDLVVAGWAIDDPRKAAAGNVDVVVDHIPYAARYPIPRKDVAAYYKEPSYENSGFDFTIPAFQMTKGIHVFAVRVVASDGKSYWESPEFTLVVQ
jgi:hypothetical protein